MRGRGLVAGEDRSAALTPAGRDCTSRVVRARHDELEQRLADDSEGRDPQVQELLGRLTRGLAGERP